jgi:hypothetical protein
MSERLGSGLQNRVQEFDSPSGLMESSRFPACRNSKRDLIYGILSIVMLLTCTIMRNRKWTDEMLSQAVANSTSIRQVIERLGLIPAGGNYVQISRYIKEKNLDTEHFLGRGWNKGGRFIGVPAKPLKELLVKGSLVQSFKLKKRLFSEGLKEIECEECGWKKVSPDGRIPLELDHINGDRWDNRIANLRVLCPNCHSLKPTHRGKNKKRR